MVLKRQNKAVKRVKGLEFTGLKMNIEKCT